MPRASDRHVPSRLKKSGPGWKKMDITYFVRVAAIVPEPGLRSVFTPVRPSHHSLKEYKVDSKP